MNQPSDHKVFSLSIKVADTTKINLMFWQLLP